MKNYEQIKQLQQQLESELKQINNENDVGDSLRLENIHEYFTVNINGYQISLGAMDNYELFQRFLTQAAEVSEELDLTLSDAPVTSNVIKVIGNCLVDSNQVAPNAVAELVYEAVYETRGHEVADNVSDAAEQLANSLLDGSAKYI